FNFVRTLYPHPSLNLKFQFVATVRAALGNSPYTAILTYAIKFKEATASFSRYIVSSRTAALCVKF
ncbi:hypothetical protein, partial [uncultured Campylobacter sp.]|uniref:hypothetical protein n=1 Tax=uncultured Campylobacter sp. TaxID=218934 RepID=UPI0028EDB542